MRIRRWLLTLVALLVFAAGALFLDLTPPPPPAGQAAATDNPPQIVIDGLKRITTTDQGQWLSTVRATRAEYFEQTDRLWMTDPDIEGEDRQPYRITAREATLRDSNHWTLERDVVLTNNPDDEAPVRIHTDYLEYDTLTDIAETPAPVRIEQPGRMLTTAVGMVFALDTQEYELHEQVRSRYTPAE